MENIAVLTTTLYRSVNDLRFDLACRMIGSAVGNGYNALILDESPDSTVPQRFLKIGAAVKLGAGRGMPAGRRELFSWAEDTNNDFFLWNEPEKDDLNRFIPEIIAPIVSGVADIVIVGRTEVSWRSCPVLQATSERRANEIYAEVTGLKGFDPMRGPVAFNRMALPYFAKCDPTKYGSNTGYIQHVAPLEAYIDGLKLAHVEVDFFYPLAQRAEEEGPLFETMKVKWPRQFEECTDVYRRVAKALGLPK
ncbi:MAG: hypothetical protein AAB518_02880 [Patescibacteria group bacterium]